MVVSIPRAEICRMIGHAAADPRREACGLLLGGHDRIVRADPAANVAPDPSHAFEIDPAALLATQRATRAGEPALAGWYHSHPNGRAEPSPEDARRARADGALWLIVARDAVRAFRAEAGGALHGHFTPVTLRMA